jgi:hypothetical protein
MQRQLNQSLRSSLRQEGRGVAGLDARDATAKAEGDKKADSSAALRNDNQRSNSNSNSNSNGKRRSKMTKKKQKRIPSAALRNDNQKSKGKRKGKDIFPVLGRPSVPQRLKPQPFSVSFMARLKPCP